MKILITGGAGFVGSHLCVGLADRHPSWEITAMDNLHSYGMHINLERLQSAGVRFVHGDVRVASDWAKLRSDTGLILDCAAEPSVLSGTSSQNPAYCVETNLLGTFHCLEFARRCGADLFLISTSRVYPIHHLESLSLIENETRFDLPESLIAEGISFQGINEDFPLQGSRSLYGATKLASELLLTEYQAAYGLRAVVDRCSAITGPGQMGRVEQGVFALWVAAHYFGQRLSYVGYGGYGKQVRDFLHIYDFVDLVDYQIACFQQIAGKTFNVGGGRSNSISLCELTQICQTATQKTVRISTEVKTRPNDVCWYISDTRRATEECSWFPVRTIEDMTSDILKWLSEDKQRLSRLFDFGCSAIGKSYQDVD